MLRRFVRTSVILILPFIAVAALAADGRTPVFLPGALLGADGKYIVTRNIAGGAGSAIVIAAPHVDLDQTVSYLPAGPALR